MSEPVIRRWGRRPPLAAAAAALLVIGGGAGALAVAANRPTVTMAPATPVAIRSLSDDAIVTIRGRVAEVYGNRFVMADASGRALIDTGREGEGGKLVAPGQPVTVQGRFDRGFVRAAFLVGADGKVTALGPLGGPPHGDRGPGRDHGHGPDRGPGDHGPDDRDPDPRADGPPPGAVPAAGASPPAASAG